MLIIAVGFGRRDRDTDPFVFTCFSEDDLDWNSMDDVLDFLNKEHDIHGSNTDEILVFDNAHLKSHWTFEDGLGAEPEEQPTLDGD